MCAGVSRPEITILYPEHCGPPDAKLQLLMCPLQAYRYWKKSSHEYFFISNNDVLVPNGALTSLMRVMRDGGAES